VIQLVRQDAMAAAVSREKIDLPASDATAEDHVRRRAEWRLERVFSRVGEAFQMVKAAPADHADGWFLHGA
jgi:hypothetical protein